MTYAAVGMCDVSFVVYDACGNASAGTCVCISIYICVCICIWCSAQRAGVGGGALAYLAFARGTFCSLLMHALVAYTLSLARARTHTHTYTHTHTDTHTTPPPPHSTHHTPYTTHHTPHTTHHTHTHSRSHTHTHIHTHTHTGLIHIIFWLHRLNAALRRYPALFIIPLLQAPTLAYIYIYEGAGHRVSRRGAQGQWGLV